MEVPSIFVIFAIMITILYVAGIFDRLSIQAKLHQTSSSLQISLDPSNLISRAQNFTREGTASIDRVICIAELREAILNHLDVWTLIRLQGANKASLKAVRQDPVLRRRFLCCSLEIGAEAVSYPSELRLNPFLDWFATQAFGESYDCGGMYRLDGDVVLTWYFLPHATKAAGLHNSSLHQMLLTDPPAPVICLSVAAAAGYGRRPDWTSLHARSNRGEGVLDIQVKRKTGVTLGDVLHVWLSSNVVSNKAAVVGVRFGCPDVEVRKRQRERTHLAVAKQYYADAYRHNLGGAWAAVSSSLFMGETSKWMQGSKKVQNQKVLRALKMRIDQIPVSGTRLAEDWEAESREKWVSRTRDYDCVVEQATFGLIAATKRDKVEFGNGIDLTKSQSRETSDQEWAALRDKNGWNSTWD